MITLAEDIVDGGTMGNDDGWGDLYNGEGPGGNVRRFPTGESFDGIRLDEWRSPGNLSITSLVN